jgi:hypothetical protein
MHCEKMAVIGMSFPQRAVIEFPVKEGNAAGVIFERLRGVSGDACMGVSSVRRWVKHFKAETRTSPISRAVVDRKLLQLSATSKKSTSSSDKTEGIAAQLGVGHHAVQERMDIFGYREVCSRWVPIYLWIQRNTKRLELLSHPPYSPDLAPSEYHLFGSLKDHLRGHYYETDAVQKAVQSWLRGAGTDFYRRGMFKFLQLWQKCIDRDKYFVESNKRCLDLLTLP